MPETITFDEHAAINECALTNDLSGEGEVSISAVAWANKTARVSKKMLWLFMESLSVNFQARF
jgi:hypothetical protein